MKASALDSNTEASVINAINNLSRNHNFYNSIKPQLDICILYLKLKMATSLLEVTELLNLSLKELTNILNNVLLIICLLLIIMDWSHNRFSDDNIYLNEDRYEKPKEVHKEIISIIQKYYNKEYTSVLDCGCATGALLYNIRKVYPHLELNGFDISPEMIEYAKKKLTNAELFVSDLGEDFKYKDKKRKQSDIVICSGVLSIFDDYKKS